MRLRSSATSRNDLLAEIDTRYRRPLVSFFLRRVRDSGGAISYQAAKPDLTRFDAHIRASVKSTSGGDTSYGGKAMLNVPLATGVFGVRGVLDYRQDGGYVDNVGTGRTWRHAGCYQQSRRERIHRAAAHLRHDL